MCEMNKTSMLLLIMLNVLLISKSVIADCRFEYIGDYPKTPSVLLTIHGDLLEPEYNPISLYYLEEVLVTCPGLNNVIETLNKPFAKATCVHGKTLNISSKSYQLSELGCKTKVTSDCRNTTMSCGNNIGTKIEIGFNIPNYSFRPLFEICYDHKKNVPLYAVEKMYGATIFYAKSSIIRPNFKIGCLNPLLTQTEADNAYKIETQKTTFEFILGRNELAEKYINTKSYLSKSHLNADADQVLNTSRTATYFYINTVPMWQQINNGNWKSLEISIRNAAKLLRENFEILTGGHDILKLPDYLGTPKDIYLARNSHFAVPKYLWKIIYSKRSGNGMAFVALNNPFYRETTMDICKNICGEYNWGTTSWNNATKGLLYCCSIEDLRRSIPQIPYIHLCSNCLSGID